MEGWDHKTKEFKSILERKVAHIYWVLTIYSRNSSDYLYIYINSIFKIFPITLLEINSNIHTKKLRHREVKLLDKDHRTMV